MNNQRAISYFKRIRLVGILVIVLSAFGTIVIFVTTRNSEPPGLWTELEARPCVPAFVDGGGPYYEADAPFRERIAPEESSGETLIVQGFILASDCTTPLAGAILDVWQANETGSYEDEWYRGQIVTDEHGYYRFETVIPKGYGEGTGYRPPHIHFKVWNEQTELITSQMFFPEVAGTPGFKDEYIMLLQSITKHNRPVHYGYHTIIVPSTR